jgi:hypothetical protein
VVNSLTKLDCPVLIVLILLQVLLNFRIAYSPPLGDIKGLSILILVVKMAGKKAYNNTFKDGVVI